MEKRYGTLYGIGVGPGDPDMITMKAVKVLEQVDVVFTASSTKNSYSLAVKIAEPYVPEHTEVRMLAFPMSKDADVLQRAWEENARRVIEPLSRGKNAAFLTLGDCLTYSTYGYLSRQVAEIAPDVEMEAVPGITSYQAAAARVNRPLVEGEQSLLVMSGVKGGDRFREFGNRSENVVFLKAYKNVSDISSALCEYGWQDESIGMVSCGLPGERIVEDIGEFETAPPDYWTLIMAKHRNGHG
ncbi:MAG: precorrin-2 C(20)-methyltransferase [Thermodesulfobacteriota bacterium]